MRADGAGQEVPGSSSRCSQAEGPHGAAVRRKEKWRDQTPPRTEESKSSQSIDAAAAAAAKTSEMRLSQTSPASAAPPSGTSPTITGVVVGKKVVAGWKKARKDQAQYRSNDTEMSAQSAESMRPVVVGMVAAKKGVAGWKSKTLKKTSESQVEVPPPDSSATGVTLHKPAPVVGTTAVGVPHPDSSAANVTLHELAPAAGTTTVEVPHADSSIADVTLHKPTLEAGTAEVEVPHSDNSTADVTPHKPAPAAGTTVVDIPHPDSSIADVTPHSPAPAAGTSAVVAQGATTETSTKELHPLQEDISERDVALEPCVAEEPSFNGDVSFNISPPRMPQQGLHAAGSRRSSRGSLQHSAGLQDLEEKTARLREECSSLREAQEMALLAEEREDAVEICRAALSGSSVRGKAMPTRTDSKSPLRSNSILVAEADKIGSPEKAESDVTGKVEALCCDLREALQRMVGRQREVERQHLEAEEAHESLCLVMGEELQDGALELACAEERLTLEEELAESWPRTTAAVISPSRDYLRPDVAHEELLTERLRRDVAQSRLERAKLRRGPGGPRLSAPTSGLISPSGPSAKVATLRTEARELRHGLKELEQGQAARHDDQPEFISLWEERLFRTAQALSNRTMRVHMGEAELRAESAEVSAMAAEAASKDLAAAQSRSEHSIVAARVLQLEASRHALEETVEPLRLQAKTCAQGYEQQKRLLFAYGAALERIGAEAPPDRLQAPQMLHSAAHGLEALIRTLAKMCGSPEVAFLRLDIRRGGRLSVQDFQTGLLLGLGIDYLAVTGLSAHKLFAKIDCGRAGVVTASDLAACCPQEWRSQGAASAALAERLRALPWAAVGGARAAFDALAAALPNTSEEVLAGSLAEAAEAKPKRHLTWSSFEELVCQQLRGMSEHQAHELFEDLAGDHNEVSDATWATAVAEPGAF